MAIVRRGFDAIPSRLTGIGFLPVSASRLSVLACLAGVSLSGCSDTDESQYADVHDRNFATVMEEGAQHSAILKSLFDGRNPVASYENFKLKFPKCCEYVTEAAYNSPSRVESNADKFFDDVMSFFFSRYYVYTISVDKENYFIGRICDLEGTCKKI